MAASGLAIDQTSFSCPICLDLLKDPVSIPCGHSYCMSCIKTHWDGEGGKQSYSCPQCRHHFTVRPALVKNTMLSVLMEGLKKSGAPAVPQPPSAADGHVLCDLCSGTKVKAVKSCLQCLVSYCKEHLQPHYDVPALKKHKLVEPIENLQENLCSVHDEVMKMFCRTDQQCICFLCSLDQHKGHHTVTAAAERTEKQRELQAFQQDILQRISHKEKDMDGLHHHLKNSSCSADAAVEHSDRSLKELLHLLEKKISLVKQQVRSHQEAEENRVKVVQDKVQQEIRELQRKLTELDTLSLSEDHVHFLQTFASLSKVSEAPESGNSCQSPPPFMDMVTATVLKLRSSLQETSLPAGAQRTAASQQKGQEQPHQGQVLPPSERNRHRDSQPQQEDGPPLPTFGAPPSLPSFQTPLPPVITFGAPPTQPIFGVMHPAQEYTECGECREELLPPPRHYLKQKPPAESIYWKLKPHFRKLTWDPRSLNDFLELSEENTLVRHMSRSQNHRPHQLRFTELPQAVSRETLNGQCYFEMNVYTPHDKMITVAVTYKDSSDEDGCFGMNDKSWALQCNRDYCVFWHDGNHIVVPKGGILVGVFVDYRAGVLSFYRHWDDLNLIHSVKTTFTQPLVAGTWFEVGAEGKFVKRPY